MGRLEDGALEEQLSMGHTARAALALMGKGTSTGDTRDPNTSPKTHVPIPKAEGQAQIRPHVFPHARMRTLG